MYMYQTCNIDGLRSFDLRNVVMADVYIYIYIFYLVDDDFVNLVTVCKHMYIVILEAILCHMAEQNNIQSVSAGALAHSYILSVLSDENDHYFRIKCATLFVKNCVSTV